jgi:hypothetical protein
VLWTILQADLLYSLMTVPLVLGLQIGLAAYQKRAAAREYARGEASRAERRAKSERRHAPLRIGRYRRRRTQFTWR